MQLNLVLHLGRKSTAPDALTQFQNTLKFAHRYRRSYVVGGWRPQEGTADRLAALLVGEITEAGLVYRGRVGSGIGAVASRALTPLVAPLARADSPFDDEVPVIDARGTFWVDPVNRLVVVFMTPLIPPSVQMLRGKLHVAIYR